MPGVEAVQSDRNELNSLSTFYRMNWNDL